MLEYRVYVKLVVHAHCLITDSDISHDQAHVMMMMLGRVIFFRGTHIVMNNFGSIFNYIF